MTALEAYHVGILVANIEEAADRFSAVLGVTFNPPTTMHGERMDDDGINPIELTVTYSQEGPLHYELVQSQRCVLRPARWSRTPGSMVLDG